MRGDAKLMSDHVGELNTALGKNHLFLLSPSLFALNCLPSTVCPQLTLLPTLRPFQRQPSEGARFLPGEGGAAQGHHDEDEPAAGPERAHAEGEKHAAER